MLAGPTASGKSEVALHLATKLDGEIISVDSMQVYRGLDIGTAKPNAFERNLCPHHLIDVVEPSEPFDVSRFRNLTLAVCEEITARAKTPILCGGTGMYFKALIEGLDHIPDTPAALRTEVESSPIHDLLAELRRLDPEAVDRVDIENPRRLQRAVELLRLTGRPLAESRRRWSDRPHDAGAVVYLMVRDREDLVTRIESRVDRMFAQGLVEETRELLNRGLAGNRTAMQSIGYRQVVEFLRGARNLDDTIASVKQRTRRLAKRQMTWFRNQLPTELVEVDRDEPAQRTAERILERWRHCPSD